MDDCLTSLIRIATGQVKDNSNNCKNSTDVSIMNEEKTGELFRFGLLGLYHFSGNKEHAKQLCQWALTFGRIYQKLDDMDDLDSDLKLGKTTEPTLKVREFMNKSVHKIDKYTGKEKSRQCELLMTDLKNQVATITKKQAINELIVFSQSLREEGFTEYISIFMVDKLCDKYDIPLFTDKLANEYNIMLEDVKKCCADLDKSSRRPVKAIQEIGKLIGTIALPSEKKDAKELKESVKGISQRLYQLCLSIQHLPLQKPEFETLLKVYGEFKTFAIGRHVLPIEQRWYLDEVRELMNAMRKPILKNSSDITSAGYDIYSHDQYCLNMIRNLKNKFCVTDTTVTVPSDKLSRYDQGYLLKLYELRSIEFKIDLADACIQVSLKETGSKQYDLEDRALGRFITAWHKFKSVYENEFSDKQLCKDIINNIQYLLHKRLNGDESPWMTLHGIEAEYEQKYEESTVDRLFKRQKTEIDSGSNLKSYDEELQDIQSRFDSVVDSMTQENTPLFRYKDSLLQQYVLGRHYCTKESKKRKSSMMHDISLATIPIAAAGLSYSSVRLVSSERVGQIRLALVHGLPTVVFDYSTFNLRRVEMFAEKKCKKEKISEEKKPDAMKKHIDYGRLTSVTFPNQSPENFEVLALLAKICYEADDIADGKYKEVGLKKLFHIINVIKEYAEDNGLSDINELIANVITDICKGLEDSSDMMSWLRNAQSKDNICEKTSKELNIIFNHVQSDPIEDKSTKIRFFLQSFVKTKLSGVRQICDAQNPTKNYGFVGLLPYLINMRRDTSGVNLFIIFGELLMGTTTAELERIEYLMTGMNDYVSLFNDLLVMRDLKENERYNAVLQEFTDQNKDVEISDLLLEDKSDIKQEYKEQFVCSFQVIKRLADKFILRYFEKNHDIPYQDRERELCSITAWMRSASAQLDMDRYKDHKDPDLTIDAFIAASDDYVNFSGEQALAKEQIKAIKKLEKQVESSFSEHPKVKKTKFISQESLEARLENLKLSDSSDDYKNLNQLIKKLQVAKDGHVKTLKNIEKLRKNLLKKKNKLEHVINSRVAELYPKLTTDSD
ncbi:hypothetical protein DID76_01420 [Candidatus Marinamargulisbacteria bacterium SCGC AG-414-C22]|nr:hypothetical protein DID76_01420 [Candidatus Marinamargulisbacteria bacterium SCGC AG-414-C22]